MLFTGCRNGEVRLFDVRSPECRLGGAELLDGRFRDSSSPPQGDQSARKQQRTNNGQKSHSAVTHLRLVRDWELLVATSAGNVSFPYKLILHVLIACD